MAAKIAFSVLVVSVICLGESSYNEMTFKEYERAAVTKAPLTTKKTTPKPVHCVHCTDLGCFTSPVSSPCTSTTETYCMSTITDHYSGTRDIVKTCATLVQCQQAYSRTRTNSRCLGIDHQVSGYDMTCSYCCKGDNCNGGPTLKPVLGVQFVGKPIVG